MTRRGDETYEPTCVVAKIQRRSGWMFWGCFSGQTGKGIGSFWEKDWKTITAASYIEHTIPMIDVFMKANPGLFLMQDHAPGHRAKATIAEFERLGIQLIKWPPYSPDLNPIETVWDIMKEWLRFNYPELEDTQTSYKKLRTAVTEAWEAVGQAKFSELLAEMPARCQAVVDAAGLYTKY